MVGPWSGRLTGNQVDHIHGVLVFDNPTVFKDFSGLMSGLPMGQSFYKHQM